MYKGKHKQGEIELVKQVKVYENKFCEFFDDDVKFPDGGLGKFLRLKMKGNYSVAILPITKQGEMVFIKTFRHSARGWGFEVPKGYGATGEKPLDCAKRELLEETGLSSKKFTYLGMYHESPSTMQCGLHCFVAQDCKKTSSTKLENTEVIKESIIVNSIDELPSADYKDAITEMMVYKYLSLTQNKK